MGDKDIPDDREIIPGETPHELTGPIYFFDFVSNSMGIFAALLGLRSVREQSFVIAQRYVRVTILLIFVSAIQLSMEVYAFSDRYQKNNPSSSSGGGSSSSSSSPSMASPSGSEPGAPPTAGRTGTQKQWDDLAFTVAINLLVRGMFWFLILNTAKKYFAAFIEVERANGDRQVPEIDDPQVVQGTPVVGLVTSV